MYADTVSKFFRITRSKIAFSPPLWMFLQFVSVHLAMKRIHQLCQFSRNLLSISCLHSFTIRNGIRRYKLMRNDILKWFNSSVCHECLLPTVSPLAQNLEWNRCIEIESFGEKSGRGWAMVVGRSLVRAIHHGSEDIHLGVEFAGKKGASGKRGH